MDVRKTQVEVTVDGVEEVFAVNHLSYFALTLRLLDKLKEMQYPNLYHSIKSTHEFVEEYQADQLSNAVAGFSMTSKTRPLIVAKMEEFIRNNLITINSSRLLSEMRTFIWNSGRAEAMRSYNDDLIMACAIGCWVRDTALTVNKKDMEYNKAFIGAITKTSNEIDTRIKGMIGTRDLKFKEDMNKHQKTLQQYPWLYKG